MPTSPPRTPPSCLPASPPSNSRKRCAVTQKKSLTEDAQEVFRAIALIELGARMQVLESELTLSRYRMIRLYREIKGVSPPKGMLPFSADWYMTWLANIHASLFYNKYGFLEKEAGCPPLHAL